MDKVELELNAKVQAKPKVKEVGVEDVLKVPGA
jgi:hypothetical protein